MKLTTNKQAPSHDRLMFWGELAANNRDLSKAVGRYNPESDELLLAGDDDLTKKISKLIDIGVQFKVKKHKNGNFYLSDTFGINESEELTELTDPPSYKSGALSFTDFVKSQESPEEQPEKQEKKENKAPKKADKKKSLSETENELIQLMRDRSSKDLINATLEELKGGYDPYATDF